MTRKNVIHTGDAFDVLPDLPDESVHAVITDPPYGLNFMPNVTNGWDDFEPKEYQEWSERWARECKRVLKPGGHLLAFSGNRTHHRLFTGVEDAGYEIRDTLTWHYGSGFPKASDVSKTIDKRADAEREVVGTYDWPDGNERNTPEHQTPGDVDYGDYGDQNDRKETAPATDAARKWDGWKTGLKPATEFVVMARKPFDGATVDCVLEHGTGALNVDACRIDGADGSGNWPGSDLEYEGERNAYQNGITAGDKDSEGRYPSNVIFDEVAAEQLDQVVGELADSTQNTSKRGYESNVYGDKSDADAGGADGYAGSGGPSRYFYTSKASRSERTEGGSIENDHPTVKPGDLMEWLIKLVTREGQNVLDPFAGSGTTCKAAKALGREFVGIERQAKYADIARVRCGLTPDDPSVVRSDDAQSGVEEWT